MKYEAHITKAETGETRISHKQLDDPTYENGSEYPDGFLYIWEEGNYCCDCNRELFWLRAGKSHEKHEAHVKCSNGRFKVRLVVEGKTVYED